VVSITQAVDGVELAAAFDFAADGRLARTRFPAWALALEYAWDERGRPLSLAWTHGDGAPAVLARFGYGDAEGAPAVWRETADGVRAETAHHPADGRLLHQRLLRGGGVVDEMAVEHGPGWRIEREGERTYRYDQAGRLAGAEEGGLRWSFRWTATDDLAAEEGPTPSPELVETDAAGRVTRVVRGGADVVYRYDAAHQLTEVRENGDRVARFRYDHKGRLLAKETAAARERYLYGADDRLVAVANGDGTPRLV
jgi:YD repeat-containing protein